MSSTPPPQMGSEQGSEFQAPQPPKKSNTTLIVLLALGGACLLCVPITAAVLFPVFSQARLAAKKTVVMSNMKQLGVGMMIYLADYDETFPPSMSSEEDWDYVQPYVKAPLQYPLENSEEFVMMNSELAGTRSVELASPESTVMFTFVSEEIPGVRFEAYADSSVRAIDVE